MGVSFDGVGTHIRGSGGTYSATSYLPSVRAQFEFPLSADADVQRWRRMGASWQTIANNFGCSVDKVRRTWDLSYVPLHEPAKPVVAAVPARPDRAAEVRRSLRSDRPTVIASPQVRRVRAEQVLRALTSGPREMRDIADLTGLSAYDASSVLQSLKVLGDVTGDPTGRGHAHEWRLTAAGRERVAGLGACAHG